MKKRCLAGFLIFFSLLCSAFATDLMDIYQLALANDPTFKEAYGTYMANREAIPQAMAALYPQINTTSQIARNYLDVGVSGLRYKQTYNSTQWGINGSQAVFNYQAWAAVQKAKATVKSSQATFNDAAQDLMIRTAQAYFAVLYVQDTLKYALAKKAANKRQLDQAQQRFKVGLDPITSVYEAQAAYDRSIAEVISTQRDQLTKNEDLRKITNHVYQFLSPLNNNRIPLIRPEPADVTEWITLSTKQNYKLLAARYNLQVARDNIRVNAGAGWPTLALTSNTTQVHNDVQESSFFATKKETNSNIALQFNFPVYQGGLVQANTRQAQYQFQATREVLERTYRDVTVNSRVAYNNILAGISQVKADQQTVMSQQKSLESTEAQFEVGTRTMVDVTNAQQRLFDAQRQLAFDQYNLIISILNLKYLAGTLNVQDLEEVNAWLQTTKIESFPPKKSCIYPIKMGVRKKIIKVVAIKPSKIPSIKLTKKDPLKPIDKMKQLIENTFSLKRWAAWLPTIKRV